MQEKHVIVTIARLALRNCPKREILVKYTILGSFLLPRQSCKGDVL